MLQLQYHFYDYDYSTSLTARPAPATTIKTKDEMLLETAQRLGIPTDGKTREQISEEISIKVKLLGAAA